mmetsp:Transcript_26196/g.76398  ORF Transcript_26196/g.76398 Transcript_26196/m.76398 type:complete len:209 (-) Transcript_26196:396-1022(-)
MAKRRWLAGRLALGPQTHGEGGQRVTEELAQLPLLLRLVNEIHENNAAVKLPQSRDVLFQSQTVPLLVRVQPQWWPVLEVSRMPPEQRHRSTDLHMRGGSSSVYQSHLLRLYKVRHLALVVHTAKEPRPLPLSASPRDEEEGPFDCAVLRSMRVDALQGDRHGAHERVHHRGHPFICSSLDERRYHVLVPEEPSVAPLPRTRVAVRHG